MMPARSPAIPVTTFFAENRCLGAGSTYTTYLHAKSHPPVAPRFCVNEYQHSFVHAPRLLHVLSLVLCPSFFSWGWGGRRACVVCCNRTHAQV